VLVHSCTNVGLEPDVRLLVLVWVIAVNLESFDVLCLKNNHVVSDLIARKV
jgi:hypothetical protein